MKVALDFGDGQITEYVLKQEPEGLAYYVYGTERVDNMVEERTMSQWILDVLAGEPERSIHIY